MIPDISGTAMFLSDLEPGVPVPAVMFMAPFEWREPSTGGFLFRAGMEAGGRESFHCRGNGTAAGHRFFSAGWFSAEGWGYLVESAGLLRLSASGVDYASTDFLLAEAFSGRLSVGLLADSGGREPVALWETPTLTCAAGSQGAGMGFAFCLAPWLTAGPAVTGGDPWLKSAIILGPFEFRSTPGIDRSGRVRGTACAAVREDDWLVAGFYNGDSLVFGGRADLPAGLSFSAVMPEPGFGAALETGKFALSASTRGGEEWSAGAALSLSSATLSIFGLYGDGWKAGIGLELGKGGGSGGEPGLGFPR